MNSAIAERERPRTMGRKPDGRYLRQVLLRNGIPFEVRIPDGGTKRAMEGEV
jgi:hypothetical protein